MKPTKPTELAAASFIAATCLLGAACQPPPTSGHFGASGLAAGGGSDVEDNSLILRSSPNLGGSPPPAIAKPGLRLTYRWGAATIPGEGLNFEEDPDGNWINKATGQRYAGSQKEGTGGGGYAETVVVAMDDQTAALSIVSYGFGLGDAPKFLMRTIGGGQAGFAGGAWASPDLLNQLPASLGGGVDVMHMPYKSPNGNVDATWIKSNGTQSYEASVYDQKTGLLIHSGSAGVGAVSPIHAEGQNNTGNLMLTDTTLLKVDQVNVPWAADPMPDWISKVHSLTYEGIGHTVIGMDIPSKVKLTLDVLKQRSGWTLFKQAYSVTVGNSAMPIVTPSMAVTGPYDFAAPWIPPAGLARLQPNQQLDTNTITQITTKVLGHQRGPKGDMVVIEQSNATGGVDRGYDMNTGLLVQMRIVDVGLHSDTTLQLTGQS